MLLVRCKQKMKNVEYKDWTESVRKIRVRSFRCYDRYRYRYIAHETASKSSFCTNSGCLYAYKFTCTVSTPKQLLKQNSLRVRQYNNQINILQRMRYWISRTQLITDITDLPKYNYSLNLLLLSIYVLYYCITIFKTSRTNKTLTSNTGFIYF